MKRNVAGLSDPSFSDAFDDLLQAATEPSSRLMENAFWTARHTRIRGGFIRALLQ